MVAAAAEGSATEAVGDSLVKEEEEEDYMSSHKLEKRPECPSSRGQSRN